MVIVAAERSTVPEVTEKTLNKLGVNNIYLVDIGGNIKSDILGKIWNVAHIKKHFVDLEDIYDYIRGITGSNDVVFTTLESWTPWLVKEKAPADELKKTGELFIGPSAYIAAHHGTPVLIVDQHPELSQSIVWHNEFWRNYASKRSKLPSVAPMVLSGRQVYEFLEEHGFDEKGSMETMITVADQFDIGITWDRTFVVHRCLVDFAEHQLILHIGFVEICFIQL